MNLIQSLNSFDLYNNFRLDHEICMITATQFDGWLIYGIVFCRSTKRPTFTIS